ncbi:MAG: hypothetical protein NTX76_06365 [Alphaproteobacteria bacterium]|nr:hypothetical protein [Alphaproteobacteria bacterium]
MADYGVLVAMRQALSGTKGAGKSIHFAIPSGASFPMIVLELEEIWTAMRLGGNAAHARLKIKASIVGKHTSGRESLGVAEEVRLAIDGKSLAVEDGMVAVVKLSGSVIDFPQTNSPRSVQQFYDVLIRG